jgi:hypothetical protein
MEFVETINESELINGTSKVIFSMDCMRLVPFLEYGKIDHLLSQFIPYHRKN